MKTGRDPAHPYVSRGGIKLRHALEAFGIDVKGLRCVDMGCSTGGFTDCLLRAGAARVISIDTAYGQFAWKLRNDPRVRLRERTNALHTAPASEEEVADLVVIDLGWTPQRLCVPAARRWLGAGGARIPGVEGKEPSVQGGGRIITLIKPHYEIEGEEKGALDRGVLPIEVAEGVANRVLGSMGSLGFRVMQSVRSPIEGSAEKSRGNAEWLALLEPTG
ncbi:MAG: SAM-dependent methyltransferase [Phycisphaerales bacterium]